MNYNVSLNYRSDDRTGHLLSETSKHRRYRKTLIGIQTSIIAWVVELSGTITIIIIHYLATQIGFDDQWVVWIVISIYFVLIPGCYLLFTDDCRMYIAEAGWRNSLKINYHHNQVAPCPMVNLGLANTDKTKPGRAFAAPRIPTVSRNIDEKI